MEKPSQTRFWTTALGIVTATAGMLSALGGLLLTLSQLGIIGSTASHELPSQMPPGVAVAPEDHSPKTPGVSAKPDSDIGEASSRTPGDVILGTRDQYIFTSESDLIFAGTTIVSWTNGHYVMIRTHRTQRRGLVHALAISDVECDGSVWSFTSHWKTNLVRPIEQRRGESSHVRRRTHPLSEGSGSLSCDTFL